MKVSKTDHHPLGPSAASRWMYCPGSYALIERMKREGWVDAGSDVADEGDLAHEIAAIGLLMDTDTGDLIRRMRSPKGAQLADEDAVHIDDYIAYVRRIQAQEKRSRLYVEQRLNLSGVVPRCWGTADAVIISPTAVHVIDFKFGKGVKVDAYRNEQLMLYSSGLKKHWIEKGNYMYKRQVVLHIFQPRYPNISTWSPVYDELVGDIRDAQALAANILAGRRDGEYLPGETQCRFCPAKHKCPALTEQAVALMDGETADTIVATNDNKKLGELMTQGKTIKMLVAAVEKEVKRRLECGQVVPGFKLVEGRQRREWGQFSHVELPAKLGNAAYAETKLVGITRAKQLLKENTEMSNDEIDKFISATCDRVAGKPTIAHEGDKRPALTTGAIPPNDVGDLELLPKRD